MTRGRAWQSGFSVRRASIVGRVQQGDGSAALPVGTAPESQGTIVRRKGDTPDHAAQRRYGQQLLPGCQVPDLHRAIPTGGGQYPAVVRKGKAIRRKSVPR